MESPVVITAARALSGALLIPLLSSAAPAAPPAGPGPADSAAPATATPETVHFGPCPPDVTDSPEVQCGQVRVPLDYARPDGPQIPIAISRIRASGPESEHRGALLVNPGGPGGTGLDYAESKRAQLPDSVRRAYDIVGFDPRGVGRSAPVDCGPAGGLFEHPRPDPVPAGPAEERAYLDGLRRLADDCARGAGAELEHINTANTARDMDRIRNALGQPKLNYLGVSYGTYLGAAYAAEFPRRTGRMVLDSVVGPDQWHRFDVRQGFAMIRQRDVLFDWIAAHPEFGLGTDRDAVRAHYLAARDRLPAGELGADEFDRAVYRALSRTERWKPFAEALAHLLRTGDGAQLSAEDDRNYEAALRTVKCADSRRPTPAEVIGSVRALRAADPQPVLTGLEATTCAFWAPPRETPRYGHPAMPPVLLTQAEHDPTTPLDGALRMRDELPGSRIAVLDESYSHGAFASQRSACLDGTAARYLLTGELPGRDVRCAGPGLP